MSVSEKMTAIANEVRSLAGVADKLGLDEMAAHTKDANDEVTTQEDLIAQIQTALQGKAAGVAPEDLDAVLAEQEALIAELQAVLAEKASGGGGGELPEGYRRCDYIQFSGSQWVDTGIIGTQDTQVHASFTWENSTQRHLFGCASSDNTKSITSYMNGSWRFGAKSASKSIGTKNPMLPYAVLVNKTTISITGSATSISGVADFETVGTLLLGGARDADGTYPGVGINGRVFYFNLWQGDEMVRKLVPVTDGTVYRFYDMVSNAFFDSVTSTPLEGGSL